MENMVEIISVLRRILILGLVVYLVITGLLYLYQDRLIFFRQGISTGRIEYIRDNYPHMEEISVATPDNITLYGWLVHSGREGPSPLIIYFGGNAEEVSWMIEQQEEVSGWSLLLVNYRGYGLSQGRPGEKEMVRDALLLYDSVAGREEIDPEKIVAMGRSLGTAMAVYLSAHRNIAGTILVSPFASIADIARSSFPFFPVRHLLKHQFNVLPLAASVENPMLTLVASDDTVIPLHHSKRLFQAWKGEKNFHLIAQSDHNTLSFDIIYWQRIREFLNTLSDGH
jgi:uncharacterized protein